MSKAIDSKYSDCFDAALGWRGEKKADRLIVGFVTSVGLGVGTQGWVLRLGDANDKHDLVVRSHGFAIDASRLRVDWAGAVVILLRGLSRILLSLSLDHIIIGRPTLDE